jgi:hypothetical protein
MKSGSGEGPFPGFWIAAFSLYLHMARKEKALVSLLIKILILS